MYPAKVTGVDEENRVVSVDWIGAEGGRRGIVVVNDMGSYNMPRIHDTGLVLGNGIMYYWLGKIEYGYNDKTQGNQKDITTGKKLLASVIKEGEVFIGSLVNRISLSMTNSGSFSLINGFLDGLSYLAKYRLLRLNGQRVEISGNGTEVNAGACMRNIPGAGTKVMPDETGVGNAQEFFAQTLKAGIKTARVAIGYVRNSLGVDEQGSFPLPLNRVKALLEVCLLGAAIGDVRIDEAGNVEVRSSTGTVLLNAPIVKLGNIGAGQPVPKGTSLLEWLNNHTHATATGPSGPASAGTYGPALVTLLSPTVLVP
jgi:hypothetical protein